MQKENWKAGLQTQQISYNLQFIYDDSDDCLPQKKRVCRK
jgi:hypothetical protein